MKPFRLHLLDVGAGGEGLFAAGEQDAADLVVGLEVVDGGGDLAKHAERQRVEHFRPVQRDDADRALALDNDVFERRHDPPRVAEFAGNVPAGGMGFKWGDATPDAALGTRPVSAGPYAMNMRAAEAIVSKAPKAMKIFPISEVWSRSSCRCSPA